MISRIHSQNSFPNFCYLLLYNFVTISKKSKLYIRWTYRCNSVRKKERNLQKWLAFVDVENNRKLPNHCIFARSHQNLFCKSPFLQNIQLAISIFYKLKSYIYMLCNYCNIAISARFIKQFWLLCKCSYYVNAISDFYI